MSGSAPVVITSLMQWAARSAPQARSAPRSRASTILVPTPSVEAARKRPSPSGWSPAKAPNPAAAGGLAPAAQPFDDGLGGGERHARGLVRLRLRHGRESTPRSG